MKGNRLTDVYDWATKTPPVRRFMKRRLNKRIRQISRQLAAE
jgi:hypothetical protein